MNANIGEILREAYEKVGVELTLRTLDWAAFSQRFAAGEFDVAPIQQRVHPAEPGPVSRTTHSSQVPARTGRTSASTAIPRRTALMESLRAGAR